MKTFKLLLGLMIFFTMIHGLSAQTPYKIVAEKLNVRSSPSAQASILGTLNKGEIVMVSGVTNGWVSFPFRDKVGYASLFTVKKVDPSELPQTETDPNNPTTTHQVEDSSVTSAAKATNDEMGDTLVYQDNSINDAEKEKTKKRKSGFMEFGYSGGTFKEAKETGSYGMSLTYLPWEVASDLYLGLRVQPFAFNYGLVDSEFATDVIRFGPAVGYYIAQNIVMTMSYDIMCAFGFGGSDTKAVWGMSISPALYIGKRGLYLGPQFTKSFKGGGKMNTGFRIGFFI